MVRQAHHERININQKYYRKRSVSRVEFKTIIRHNYYRNNEYKLWVALSTVEDRFQATRNGEKLSKTNHQPAKQDRVSQDSNEYNHNGFRNRVHHEFDVPRSAVAKLFAPVYSFEPLRVEFYICPDNSEKNTLLWYSSALNNQSHLAAESKYNVNGLATAQTR